MCISRDVQGLAMPARYPSQFMAGAYAEALQRASTMTPSLSGLLPAPPTLRPPFQRPPSLQEILASLPNQLVDFRNPNANSSSYSTGAG